MTEDVIENEELRRRVLELEAELGEAVAAQAIAAERLVEAEAALEAAHAVLAAVAEPAFAMVLEASRNPVAARLRRRLQRSRARNRALTDELARLRASRTLRWTAPVRNALRRVREARFPGGSP